MYEFFQNNGLHLNEKNSRNNQAINMRPTMEVNFLNNEVDMVRQPPIYSENNLSNKPSQEILHSRESLSILSIMVSSSPSPSLLTISQPQPPVPQSTISPEALSQIDSADQNWLQEPFKSEPLSETYNLNRQTLLQVSGINEFFSNSIGDATPPQKCFFLNFRRSDKSIKCF